MKQLNEKLHTLIDSFTWKAQMKTLKEPKTEDEMAVKLSIVWLWSAEKQKWVLYRQAVNKMGVRRGRFPMARFWWCGIKKFLLNQTNSTAVADVLKYEIENFITVRPPCYCVPFNWCGASRFYCDLIIRQVFLCFKQQREKVENGIRWLQMRSWRNTDKVTGTKWFHGHQSAH